MVPGSSTCCFSVVAPLWWPPCSPRRSSTTCNRLSKVNINHCQSNLLDLQDQSFFFFSFSVTLRGPPSILMPCCMGLTLEVGARRAPELLVQYNMHIMGPYYGPIHSSIKCMWADPKNYYIKHIFHVNIWTIQKKHCQRQQRIQDIQSIIS